ncbi:MAG: type II toxin-antitoxin system RelE/ParE family toxin [Deltaproteobacteria bacterium]|nr:type II toxin-antitoxin system RelE/ParE family toxin [Deltaproteobacteria bacterium]
MPKTSVVFFKDERGMVPVLQWLDRLPDIIEAKALVRIEELAQYGHEMRRPHAAYLRDGIYELRWKHQSVNYRILYFFRGRSAVILSHGLTKEDVVPPREIERAIKNKILCESNPHLYVYEGA